MRKTLFFCLLAAVLSIAQKQRVVVLPTIADQEAQLSVRQLNMLTDKLRSIATDSLPKESFILLREDFVRDQLGDAEYFQACKDGVCIGTLMEKVQANFGARCEVFSMSNKLWLKFELYGTLIGDAEAGMIHIIPGEEVNDFAAMLALLDKKLPEAFKKILPSKSLPPVNVVQFVQAPIAAQEPILPSKPYYISGGDGKWNLIIGGRPFPLREIMLYPGIYEAKLSHECYEDINFNAEVKIGKYEILNISNKIVPKKNSEGNLVLNSIKNNRLVKDSVFAGNGEYVGTTPLSSSLSVCTKMLFIGNERSIMPVNLERGKTVEYTHKENSGVKWGFFFGFGSPSLRGLDDLVGEGELNESSLAIEIGLMTLWPINSKIDLEVSASMGAFDIAYDENNYDYGYYGYDYYTFSAGFIDIPVLLRYYLSSFYLGSFHSSLYGGAGIKIGIPMYADFYRDYYTDGYSAKLNTPEISLVFSGGLQISSIFLDFKYFKPITDFANFTISENTKEKYSVSRGGLSIGIGFLF